MTPDFEEKLKLPVALGHQYTVFADANFVTKNGRASIMLNLDAGGDELGQLLEAGLVGLSFTAMAHPDLPEHEDLGRALGWEILIQNLIKCWRETDGYDVTPNLYFAINQIVMFAGHNLEPSGEVDDGMPS